MHIKCRNEVVESLTKFSYAGLQLVLSRNIVRAGELVRDRLILTIPPLQKTKKGYLLSAKCDTAVMCRGCGGIFGDPYAGIDFTKTDFEKTPDGVLMLAV